MILLCSLNLSPSTKPSRCTPWTYRHPSQGFLPEPTIGCMHTPGSSWNSSMDEPRTVRWKKRISACWYKFHYLTLDIVHLSLEQNIYGREFYIARSSDIPAYHPWTNWIWSRETFNATPIPEEQNAIAIQCDLRPPTHVDAKYRVLALRRGISFLLTLELDTLKFCNRRRTLWSILLKNVKVFDVRRTALSLLKDSAIDPESCRAGRDKTAVTSDAADLPRHSPAKSIRENVWRFAKSVKKKVFRDRAIENYELMNFKMKEIR